MRVDMSRKVPTFLPPLTISTWPVCWITNSRESPGALETPMALVNTEAMGLRLIETGTGGGGTAAGGAIDTKPLPDAAGVVGLVPHAAATAGTIANAIAVNAAETKLPRPSEFTIRHIPWPSNDSGNQIVSYRSPLCVCRGRPVQRAA